MAVGTLPYMRFRWDWLEPVLRAPYVPTLGPVAPDTLSADLFNAVVDVAGTGRFLPYDKDKRWFGSKDEHVITGEIIHRPGLTLIPTLSTRGHGLVRIHHYADQQPDLQALAELGELGDKLCATHGASKHRIIWFQTTPEGARTHLMLKVLAGTDRRDHPRVVELTQRHQTDTFAAFTREIGPEGFAFLHQRITAGIDDGPVLVTVEDDRIVGALGPLATITDSNGTRLQTPQYFAVHPDYRGNGHGRALWRASMNWGATNGATYKILQAAKGSPAERLYLSEGLESLGFLCTT